MTHEINGRFTFAFAKRLSNAVFCLIWKIFIKDLLGNERRSYHSRSSNHLRSLFLLIITELNSTKSSHPCWQNHNQELCLFCRKQIKSNISYKEKEKNSLFNSYVFERLNISLASGRSKFFILVPVIVLSINPFVPSASLE